jgi:hypothetical protein
MLTILYIVYMCVLVQSMKYLQCAWSMFVLCPDSMDHCYSHHDSNNLNLFDHGLDTCGQSTFPAGLTQIPWTKASSMLFECVRSWGMQYHTCHCHPMLHPLALRMF